MVRQRARLAPAGARCSDREMPSGRGLQVAEGELKLPVDEDVAIGRFRLIKACYISRGLDYEVFSNVVVYAPEGSHGQNIVILP